MAQAVGDLAVMATRRPGRNACIAYLTESMRDTFFPLIRDAMKIVSIAAHLV